MRRKMIKTSKSKLLRVHDRRRVAQKRARRERFIVLGACTTKVQHFYLSTIIILADPQNFKTGVCLFSIQPRIIIRQIQIYDFLFFELQSCTLYFVISHCFLHINFKLIDVIFSVLK